MRWILFFVIVAMNANRLVAQTTEELVFQRSGAVDGEALMKVVKSSKRHQQDIDKEVAVGNVKGIVPKGAYQTDSLKLLVDGKVRWTKEVVYFLDREYANGHERFGLYDVTHVGGSFGILYVHLHGIHLDIAVNDKEGKVTEPTTIDLPLKWSSSCEILRGRLISGDGGLFAMFEIQRGSNVDVELWEIKDGKPTKVWSRGSPVAENDGSNDAPKKP